MYYTTDWTDRRESIRTNTWTFVKVAKVRILKRTQAWTKTHVYRLINSFQGKLLKNLNNYKVQFELDVDYKIRAGVF